MNIYKMFDIKNASNIKKDAVEVMSIEEILARYEKYIKKCEEIGKTPMNKDEYIKKYKVKGRSKRPNGVKEDNSSIIVMSIEEILARYEKYIKKCEEIGKTPMNKDEYIKKYKVKCRSGREGTQLGYCIDARIYKKFMEYISIYYGKRTDAYKIIEHLAEKKLDEIERTGIYSEITTKHCLSVIGEDPDKFILKKTSIKINKILSKRINETVGYKYVARFIRGLIHWFVCYEEIIKSACMCKL